MALLNGLYHFQIGLPKLDLQFPAQMKLTYTRHAEQAALNDRYGAIDLPFYLHTTDALLVEIELRDQTPVKAVFRIKYDDRLDLVLVVAISGLRYVVKTVWLNQADDKHSTLRRGMYIQPA